jgi:hypothetical protein
MNTWQFIAKLKLIKDRAIGYFSLYTYLLIVLMYFKIEMGNLLAIIFLILCIIATIIDWIWIFPKEQEIIWKRNPAYDELKKKK